ncbi:hypothetical protein PLICRDRAFT_456489 [Plicaturopsis crispa FD-325 SS-3]|nr:hypothetical protein PLICRDRAFT_456489 [Plicaturopsis crispa FD-325 SS-3]
MTSNSHLCTNCDAPFVGLPKLPRDSPVPALLETNNPPPLSKIADVAHFVSEETSRLANIEQEMFRVQALVDALARERRAVEENIKNHEALLSPMRRFPPELLSEVFTHCLPEDRRPNADRCPLLLGRVCRLWRSVSLSTPFLWSSASFHIRDNPFTPPYRDWIARAQSLPLQLKLVSRTRDSKALMESLAFCAPRLRELELSLSTANIRSLALPQTSFPNIQRLHLEFAWVGESEPAPKSLGIFEHCPQLQHVTIGIAFRLSALVLPWHQLTRVTARLSYLDDWYEVLRRSPNLLAYEAVDVGNRWLNHPSPTSVEHVGLHSLALRTQSPGFLGSMFNLMSLPSLRACTVTNTSTTSGAGPSPLPFSTAQFIAFVRRSGCSLEELQLDDVRISAEDLVRCLQHTPGLARLQLCADLVTGGGVLACLRGGGGAGCLVPRLQTLVLEFSRKWAPQFLDELCDVVASRRDLEPGSGASGQSITPIKRVELICAQRIAVSECDLAPFDQLRKDGLVIEIFHKWYDKENRCWKYTRTV